ncbi:ankyrin repeat-containing domain protein [Rostrohypoxylon terebratum]|nr:ankyrin repeat-containing domain protein [Rostrohypoxylon terebratum]
MKRRKNRDPLTDDAIREAMNNADTSPEPGVAFGKFLEGIITEQRFLQDETLSGKLAHHAAKLYPIARIILGTASFSADAAAFMPVKTAASGLLEVISFAMVLHNRKKEIVQQLESLSDYNIFLENLRGLHDSSELSRKTNNLLISMMNFLRESLEYLGTPGVMKPFNQSWEESKKLFEDARNDLDNQVSRDTQVTFFRWVKESKNESTLSSLSADISYKEKQHQYSAQRVPEIGQWVLGDVRFKEWKLGTIDGKTRVLCCVGLPGVGKTFIASQIVTHLMDFRLSTLLRSPKAQVGIAFVYCSVAEKGQHTAMKFISSIARQLVELPSSGPNPLMEIATQFERDFYSHGRIPGLRDYKAFIKRIIGLLDQTFIIVDALDECIDYDINHSPVCGALITTLTDLNAHLLVTSRNVGAVNDLKKRAASRQISVQEIEISPLHEDIKRYIHRRIYDEDHVGSHVRDLIEDRELSEGEILNEFLTKSPVIFNLVRLQMDEIMECMTLGDIKDKLKEPKKTHEQFYDAAFDRISSANGPGIRRQLGFRIIGWVLYAKRPLQSRELQHILATSALMESGSSRAKSRDEFRIREQDMLTSCHGLVIIESKTKLVSFAHSTVKEYLDSNFHERFPSIYEDIGKSCLAYISDEVFAEGPCPDDESYANRIENSPFYGYSAQYWADHVRGELELKIKENILSFLKAEKLVLSSIQAKVIEENHYKFHGRSQSYTKSVGGLWVASQLGLNDAVDALIKDKADIEAQDDKGRTALMMAAFEGFANVVDLLIDRGVDVSKRDYKGRNALHYAASANRLEVIDTLLNRAGIDVNSKDDFDDTALMFAAKDGLEEVVDKLLGSGADPSLLNHEGCTALSSAAPSGYTSMTAKLLDHGEDINSCSAIKYPALYWAVSGGHEDTIKFLLERGAKPDLASVKGITPLHYTAFYGNESIMRLLLAKTEQFDPREFSGWTPLHVAALGGRDEMVQMLLERGANANVKDMGGWTPLGIASLRGHESIARLLIDKTSDGEKVAADMKQCKDLPIYQKLKEDWFLERYDYPIAITRALDVIARGSIDTVRALLTRGLDINTVDMQFAPLIVAVAWDNIEVARLLLDNGANMDVVDNMKNSPLHVAAICGHIEMMEMLLEEGANVDAKDWRKWTPLHQAVNSGRVNMITILIRRGADINAKTSCGETPLFLAVDNWSGEMVQILLDFGADIEICNNNEDTPLALAALGGDIDIIKIILKAGANKDHRNSQGMTALDVAKRESHSKVCRLLENGWDSVLESDDGSQFNSDHGDGSESENESAISREELEAVST